jgi:hypothetical protein
VPCGALSKDGGCGDLIALEAFLQELLADLLILA